MYNAYDTSKKSNGVECSEEKNSNIHLKLA